jgi:2-C-methyl-D-erythritol 4-phosphate cytidylyltransferase
MKVTAIVPAAGAGVRFVKKKGRRKPFFIVKDKPILVHTLTALASSKRIKGIVVVVHKDDVKKCSLLIKRFNLKKIYKVIPGGKTRFESVKKGLSCVPGDSDIIFIHDGVRPLIDKKMISDSIKMCARFDAVACGVPVISTVKSVRSDLTIKATPDRRSLYMIQTPQVFKKDTISKAYRQAVRDGSRITDDAMLVERLGRKIKIVNGSYRNIKVTTPQDLSLAEVLMR